MKKNQKGFTLIELLIVIAIIGILAGVILVSTTNARNRAVNTAAKQTMASIKNGIASCCYRANQSTLNTAAGADICSNVTGSLLPALASIANTGATAVTYAVTADCGTDRPTITATVTGGNCAVSATTAGTFIIGPEGITGGTSPCAGNII